MEKNAVKDRSETAVGAARGADWPQESGHKAQEAKEKAGHVQSFFGVPLLRMCWPDIDGVNQSLADLILDLEARTPSVAQSNQGGWQSEKTLEQVRHPAIRELLSWIDIGTYMVMSDLVGEATVDELPEKWTVSAWANVNRSGHFNGMHYHVGGFWSGVYYVALEQSSAENPQAGAIGFRSPSASGIIASNTRAPRSLQQAFRQELCLQPEPGLMLIFPSWLEHWVNPYVGETPRISVAFDVRFSGVV